MQSEEVGFQSAFERGQRLGCSDVHRKVIPPSWGQNREQSLYLLYKYSYLVEMNHILKSFQQLFRPGIILNWLIETLTSKSPGSSFTKVKVKE